MQLCTSKFCHHLLTLVSFKTWMTYILLQNTNDDVVKQTVKGNVKVLPFTIKVHGENKGKNTCNFFNEQ